MENKAKLCDIDLQHFDKIAIHHIEKHFPQINSKKLLSPSGNKITILKDISYRLSLLIENTFFPKPLFNIFYSIQRLFNQKRIDRKHFLLTTEISNLLTDYIYCSDQNLINLENEICQVKSSVNYNNQLLHNFEEKIGENKQRISQLHQTFNELNESVKKFEKKVTDILDNLSQETDSNKKKFSKNIESVNSGLDDLRNILFRNKNLLDLNIHEFNNLKKQIVLDKNNKSKILNKEFYNNLRGDETEIKSRYLDRIEFILNLYFKERTVNRLKFLDLGCGRGEFMDLIKVKEHEVTGVDECSSMVQICKKKQHEVLEGDLIKCIKKLSNEKFDIVVMNHVLEHLNINYICDLLPLIRNTLKVEGFVVIEIPNIHNPFVSSSNFYLDPTHNTKLPLEFLNHLFKVNGFKLHHAEFINHSKLHRNILEKKNNKIDERFYSNDLLFIAKK